MTFQKCKEDLASMILQQNLGTYLTMAIGALVCAFVFLSWYKTSKFEASSIAVLLIGVGLVLIARTGLLPVVTGNFFDKPIFELKEIEPALEYGCWAQTAGKETTGQGEPDQENEKVVPVPVAVPAAAEGLDYLKDKGFVWVFYAGPRGQDATTIGKKLDSIGVSYQASPDDFEQVKNKKPTGTSRVVFSSPDFEQAAIALGKLIGENTGSPIVVEGPYGSISKKPIQVQLY